MGLLDIAGNDPEIFVEACMMPNLAAIVLYTFALSSKALKYCYLLFHISVRHSIISLIMFFLFVPIQSLPECWASFRS